MFARAKLSFGSDFHFIGMRRGRRAKSIRINAANLYSRRQLMLNLPFDRVAERVSRKESFGGSDPCGKRGR